LRELWLRAVRSDALFVAVVIVVVVVVVAVAVVNHSPKLLQSQT
jgi:hypothetical protein